MNFCKLRKNHNFNDLIIWIALILIAWSPHIGLDYVYTEPNGESHSLINGQYYFFIATVLAGVILFLKGDRLRLISLIRNKVFAISLALIFLGSVLSNTTLWNWRLLIIVLMISSCVIFAANIIYDFNNKRQKLAVIIFTIPFAFPVLASLILHFFGPVNIGIVIENSLHVSYTPPRWFFLNSSANGFGLDAALASITAFCFIFWSKSNLKIALSIFLFVVGSWVLFNSGTRAAFVLYCVAISTFSIRITVSKLPMFLIAALLILVPASTWLFDITMLKNYFRIWGDINKISAGRASSIVEMWNMFLGSPIVGNGFGFADRGIDFHPSNIFYTALLTEIGAWGTLGCLLAILYPVVKQGIVWLSQSSLVPINFEPPVHSWAPCILFGFTPYLFFEFNVLRVSATNQLWMMCWCITFFNVISAQTEHRRAL